jgi:glutaredoxin
MMSGKVYGKRGCGKCEAAKDKLDRFGIGYTFVDLDEPGDWRDNGAVDAMAEHQLTDELPYISLGGELLTYPQAMKALKGAGHEQNKQTRNMRELQMV